MENPVYEDTLTITADINVTITGVLSLNDTLETFEFYTTETECGQIEPAIGIEYYKNNDDGLFMYAHKSIGGIDLPKIYLEKYQIEELFAYPQNDQFQFLFFWK